MRIAQLVTRSDVMGGAVVHVRDVAQRLQRRGHDVRVLIGGHGPFVGELTRRGIPTESIPHLVRSISVVDDTRAGLALYRSLQRFRPDVIHAHTAKAGWLARLVAQRLGLPCLYTPHGWPFLEGVPPRSAAMYLRAERLAARFPSRLVNVCEYERRYALKCGVGRPAQHVVVHNGVSDVPLTSRARPHDSPPHLVMVARFEAQKDHPTLLAALARLTHLPWRATLIGDGPRQQECQRLADRLGLARRVAFPGSRDDVAAVLARSQLLVLTANWEAFPLSILEAMRAGLPVLASNVGGVPESVVDGVTGCLVGRGDATGLEASLRVLLTDAALRARLGANGRRRYESQFTLEPMITRLEHAYRVAAADVAHRGSGVRRSLSAGV